MDLTRRSFAALLAFASLALGSMATPAAALEPVTVATTRDVTNAALFLAATRGYFKAEGIELAMRAYPGAPAAAEALAGGDADLGLFAFSATAFNLAGAGKIKAIAAQVREKRNHEGNEIVASVIAHSRGLRGLENLAGKLVAVDELGSTFHYQLGQIAAHKQFGLGTMTLKPLPSIDAMVQAVATGKVDAAILPPFYARDMLQAGQARMVGLYSEIDEQQLGALFASAKTLASRRATVAKFLRAYARGAADYTAALARLDSQRKPIRDATSKNAAAAIARYVYPGRNSESARRAVAGGAYYMDPQARLDMADLARQIAWYKAQGLIDKKIEAVDVADLTFLAGN